MAFCLTAPETGYIVCARGREWDRVGL